MIIMEVETWPRLSSDMTVQFRPRFACCGGEIPSGRHATSFDSSDVLGKQQATRKLDEEVRKWRGGSNLEKYFQSLCILGVLRAKPLLNSAFRLQQLFADALTSEFVMR